MDYVTRQGIEAMRRDREKLADQIRQTQETIADSLKVLKRMDEVLATRETSSHQDRSVIN
jgi:hypothetical protein